MRSDWLAWFVLGLGFAYAGCSGSGGGGEDAAPLTVLQTAPADLEIGVSIETQVFAELSADIDSGTQSTSTFTLTELNGPAIAGSVATGAEPDIIVFTPDEPLSRLTVYTANITTGLLDVNGNALEEDYTWSFTTLNSEWGTPELIEDQNFGDAQFPQIATGPKGNAHAVWQQFDGAHTNIWANFYTRGTLWATPMLIETDDAGDAIAPRLAVDLKGVAHAVWTQFDGDTNNIFANRYTPGQGWSTAELLQTTEVTAARDPRVAVDPDGNAVAVWIQRDTEGLGNVVWANRYTPADGWGTAELIEAAFPGFLGLGIDVAMDANGNAVAVWTRSEGIIESVWSNRYDANTGWGTAELLETQDLGDALAPRVAMAPDGTAHAAWQQLDTMVQNVWTNRYTPGKGWGGAELLETQEGTAGEPAIAVDPTGVAHAVWWQSDGTFTNIWASMYTPGESWAAPGLIEQPIADPADEGSALSPQIAVDPNGNAFAVWQQEDVLRFNIWSNRFAPGEGWLTAEPIEQEEFFATNPQIAVDSERHAHAIWAQFDIDRVNIMTNRFE